jgi:hypothetical protein
MLKKGDNKGGYMKISKRMFAYMGLAGCLCLVGLVTSVGGQEPAAGHGIVGTLNPQTGTFKPLIKPTVIEDLEVAPLATTPTTGKFVANFTISVKSTIPSADVIACTLEASVADITSGHIAEETASVAAVRSGSSATCSVTIPYSWILTSPTLDMVSLMYTISTPYGGTSATALPSRMSIQTISTGKVPTSGATTTITLTPVI